MARPLVGVVLAFSGLVVGCAREREAKPADEAAHGSAAVHGSASAHDHGAAPAVAAAVSADAQPPPANPVQAEMRMLTQILELTVRSIGARDVRPIANELHRLHAAKEATTAAVRGGTYKLPKNPDQVAAFEAMDEAFHGDLGKLVVASQANDVPAAADALGALVRSCEGCHATFRP